MIQPRQPKYKIWDSKEKTMSIPMPMFMIVGYMLAKYTSGDNLGRYIFLQYTETESKNGKEIYEGDICEHDDDAFDDCDIYFQEGSFHFRTHHLESAHKHLTIKGNIYQHPKLLKKK